MKILVPVDFSKSSTNAAFYALKFAKKIHAEIVLFHAVNFDHPPMAQLFDYIEKKIEEVRVTEASHDLNLLISELKSTVKGVPISFEVTQKISLQQGIEDCIRKHHIDLMVIGTKSRTGLQKVLFGNHTSAIINKCSIPIITLPEHSRFNNIKVILYASDIREIRSELQKIIPFAKLIGASISILHVETLESDEEVTKRINESDLIKKFGYQKISLSFVRSNNILESINEFAADVKADMLVMYAHELGFFQNLFKGGLSQEEAFQSHVPVLILKKSNKTPLN
jgi:nucleotide-binding universal stress UspA family protein